MTPEQIADELMYRNYWWTRRKMATISPKVMARVYGQELAEKLEARYQADKDSQEDTLHLRLDADG